MDSLNNKWQWDEDFEWVDTEVLPEEYEDEEEPKKNLSELKRLGRIGLAACALGGMAMVGGKISETHNFLGKKCPPVSPLELVQTSSLLRAPASDKLEQVLHSGGKDYALAYRRYIDAEAKKDGFSLIDDMPYQMKIRGAQTVDEALATLNTFTSEYGFDVTVADDNKPKKRWLSRNSGEAYSGVMDGAISLMEAFHYLPVEVAKAAGLKRIEIVKTLGENEVANADTYGKRIQIAYKHFAAGDYQTYMHEVGHMIDFSECGPGYTNDKQFAALNPEDFHYQKDNPNWKKVSATQYGASKVLEDKAELYSDMLSLLSPNDFMSDSAVIREKYLLLLARLDKKVPGAAAYLASISARQKTKAADGYTMATFGIPKMFVYDK